MDYWEKKGVLFQKNTGKSVEVKYQSSTYLWYPDSPFKLYHKDRWKQIDNFKDISNTDTFVRLWGEKAERDMRELLSRDEKDLYQVVVNTQNLGRHINDVTNFFNNYDILKISSPMATRKSNIIDEVILQGHQKNLSILFITNRVSLSRDIQTKYKQYNIKHYQDHEYNKCDSLVVQFDSLFYYNPDDFDIIILDEITTLLLYMTDYYEGKEKRYKKNINFFMSLQGKKIVLSDAFIIDNPFIGKELGIYNEFREVLNVTEYKDKWAFLNKIIRESQKGIISFSSNNKSLLVKMAEHLKKRDLKVLLLTGDTKNKKEVYKLLKNTWTYYDAILYSPTLTVGVSILWDIKHHFHYDISGTVSVVDSIQMTRRSRNAKNVHYYVQGKKTYRATSLPSIERGMDIFKMINKYGIEFGITGAAKQLAIVKQMKAIFDNGHKYSFRALLKYQFKTVNNNDIIGQRFTL